MALIIETGSGVDSANSYATTDELKAYAANRGLTLPTSSKSLETALVLACDKLETYRYKGSKTNAGNALLWPRANVYLPDADEPIADDVIPARLKMAQCQLAVEAAAGTDLLPTGDGREVKREKVDVIETEYATTGSAAAVPQFTKAEALLEPLLANASFTVQTLRI